MPWLHLHVSTRGLCQACCISPITFGDVNKQSLADIWNSAKIREFRLKLLRGEKDKRCNGCYKLEEAGTKSIRQETLAKFSHKIDWALETDDEGYVEKAAPVYLDIRFSNICNFRCVTCWHGASSKWFEEAKAAGTNIADTAIIKAIDNETSFFEQLDTLIPDLEEIYFAGGEPLVMDQHYLLLDRLIAHDRTGVHLRYNTNLSLLRFKQNDVVDFWKKFKKVTVSASLDAAGEIGEEIRRDSQWASIKENLKTIKENCPHVQLEIAPTVSSLNIHAIPALHKELVTDELISVDDIYLNILSRPTEYNIQKMADKSKVVSVLDEYTAWLAKKDARPKTINSIRELIVVLQSS